MKKENKLFFEIMQKYDFVDISSFWKIPGKKILEEIQNVPEDYWRKPFNGESSQIQDMNLDDENSVNYYPGSNSDLVLAHGWKSLCFLNETGDSKDQIARFSPVFYNAYEYKNSLKDFLKNRKWTNVAKYSPTLQLFFEKEIWPYMHVGQIMVTRLDSGGLITEHEDIPKDSRRYLNTEHVHMYDMLNVFNFTFEKVEGAYAVFNNKIMPSYDDCLMLTNAGKKHWVVNMNNKPLYKIIFQAVYKKKFRDLVLSEYSNGKFFEPVL